VRNIIDISQNDYNGIKVIIADKFQQVHVLPPTDGFEDKTAKSTCYENFDTGHRWEGIFIFNPLNNSVILIHTLILTVLCIFQSSLFLILTFSNFYVKFPFFSYLTISFNK